ncbi:hypothetical protein BC828DRAFT_81369 [Blastocladiella britannica]|nr:hypothetical protein BC828DRAFT_81369 [Blastocladiella britannica]
MPPAPNGSIMSQQKTAREIALEVHAGLNSVDRSAQEAIVRAYFDKESSFGDPIVCSKGARLTRNVFLGNELAFKAIDKRIRSITESTGATTQATHHIVVIDADILYHLRWLPFTLTVRTVSKFTINTIAGKVVEYEDVWRYLLLYFVWSIAVRLNFNK